MSCIIIFVILCSIFINDNLNFRFMLILRWELFVEKCYVVFYIDIDLYVNYMIDVLCKGCFVLFLRNILKNYKIFLLC